MATLLQQGIEAAKRGEKLKARELLTQVLHADDRSERAWLWLSEVVDTNDERLQCLEQVLHINPNNQAAQLAYNKLKSLSLPLPPPVQPAQPAVSQDEAASVNGNAAAERRPFRLQAGSHTATAAPTLNRQPTVGVNTQVEELPPSITDAISPVPRYEGDAEAEPFEFPTLDQTISAPQQKAARASSASENLPLLPMLLFGTLSVTAVGGLAMIVLLTLLR